jgi:hypothetical protein
MDYTTAEDISRWLKRGKEKGATHMIVVCDTFDHGDYPVYISPDENVREIEQKYHGNMQRVMEVYSINKPWAEQIDQPRAFNYD